MPADCVPDDPAVLPAGDLALPVGCAPPAVDPLAPPAVAGIGDPDEDWLPGLESRPAGDGADGIDAVLPELELELERELALELGLELELELELELDEDDGMLLELGEEEDGVDGVLGEDEDEDEDDEGMELWDDC